MAPVVDSAKRLRAYPGDLDTIVQELRGQHLLGNLLSAVFSFVYIGVQVDVRNITVEHRARRFDHTIRELRADSYGVSGGRVNFVDNS